MMDQQKSNLVPDVFMIGMAPIHAEWCSAHAGSANWTILYSTTKIQGLEIEYAHIQDVAQNVQTF